MKTIKNDGCSKLWCRFDSENKCYSANAIAEGTFCNIDKKHICRNGKCVAINSTDDIDINLVVDGKWSDWSIEWSNCSHSCDTGIQYKERFCNNPK